MFEIKSETENGLNDDGLYYGHRGVWWFGIVCTLCL